MQGTYTGLRKNSVEALADVLLIPVHKLMFRVILCLGMEGKVGRPRIPEFESQWVRSI